MFATTTISPSLPGHSEAILGPSLLHFEDARERGDGICDTGVQMMEEQWSTTNYGHTKTATVGETPPRERARHQHTPVEGGDSWREQARA
jgi:hypothetical protein